MLLRPGEARFPMVPTVAAAEASRAPPVVSARNSKDLHQAFAIINPSPRSPYANVLESLREVTSLEWNHRTHAKRKGLRKEFVGKLDKR